MEVRRKPGKRDRRSIGNVNEIIQSIQTQQEFDNLFKNLLSHERIIAMRSADAVEKLTRKNHVWLESHKPVLLELLHSTVDKELQWHVAQLVTRVDLTDKELYVVWDKLAYWMLNKNESKIVRVNSLQALYDLSRDNPTLRLALTHLLDSVRHENIPSLDSRIRKLQL